MNECPTNVSSDFFKRLYSSRKERAAPVSGEVFSRLSLKCDRDLSAEMGPLVFKEKVKEHALVNQLTIL